MNIECQLNEIDKKLNIILDTLKISEKGKQYSLKQFCMELGLSVYKLRKMYNTNTLPIQAPYRLKRKDPTYTGEELLYMRKFLANNG